MALHHQAEQLRQAIATDPEDAQTYEGLKASVARIARDARELRDVVDAMLDNRCEPVEVRALQLSGYLADVCNYHDIEIAVE
jgi:hypothetical protein